MNAACKPTQACQTHVCRSSSDCGHAQSGRRRVRMCVVRTANTEATARVLANASISRSAFSASRARSRGSRQSDRTSTWTHAWTRDSRSCCRLDALVPTPSSRLRPGRCSSAPSAIKHAHDLRAVLACVTRRLRARRNAEDLAANHPARGTPAGPGGGTRRGACVRCFFFVFGYGTVFSSWIRLAYPQ